MLTLRELKDRVAVADTGKRVPTAKNLLESGTGVEVREVMKDGSAITVFKNGFVLYWNDGYETVFPLHECNEYRYEFAEGSRSEYERDFFENQDWYLRLILEGEDRLVKNQDTRIGSHSISYSAVSEDWGELRQDENILEELVTREADAEAVSQLLSLMTEKQGQMMVRIYIDGMDQNELAREAGITQQAISDMIRKAKKRVRKSYVPK